MTESSALDRPRGLPSTAGHIVGLVLLGLLSSLFTLPFITLPTVIPLVLFDGVGPIVWQIYFGLLIALAIPGVENVQENLYTANESNLTTDAVYENGGKIIVMLLLVILYVNIVFAGTLWLSTAIPAWAWYIAFVAPLADRTLLSVIGYSPGLVPVIGVAYLLMWARIVGDIDLDLLRELNFGIVAQSQKAAT